MYKVISEIKDKKKQLCIYNPQLPTKYIMLIRDKEAITVDAGTADLYDKHGGRTDFKKIEFEIFGQIGDELYGDIPDDEANKLYIAVVKLYRSLKSNYVFSENRIVHGRNFLAIEPTVDGLAIAAYIDLVPDFYSDNQFYIDIPVNNNEAVGRAFVEFYEELTVIANQEKINFSELNVLRRLIARVKRSYIVYRRPVSSTGNKMRVFKKDNDYKNAA